MQNLKDLSKFYKTNKYELGYIDIYEKYFENINSQFVTKKAWHQNFQES